MADYQSIYEGIRMDELWTLAGQAVQGVFVTTGGQEVELEKDENGKVHINIGYLSLFRYDEETNTIYAGDNDHPVNFAAFGEVTAAGIGGDTPTPGSLTLGGLVNVVAEADNPQLTDKILVRRAGEGVAHWTLADLPVIQVQEAPIDGKQYARKNGGWIEVQSADVTPLEDAVKSLQSQIDSVASRTGYDELVVTSLFADTIVGTNAIFGQINGIDLTAKAAYWDAHITNTSNPHNVTWAQVKPTGGVALADLTSGVQTSLSHADSLWSWFGIDSQGNIYVKDGRSFYAEGEITAGGIGSGGGGTTGGITRIYLGTDPTPYQPAEGSTEVTLPAYPTTLPASDVYPWAKAATKPTYSYSEIQGTPELSNYYTKAETEAAITGKGYITASALSGYATESWVNGRGYITASALSPYRTASAQDAIDNLIASYVQSLQSQIDSVAAKDAFDELLATSLYVDTLAASNGYFGSISVLGGIPLSALASGVQASLAKADSAYQKPASGIPLADLTSTIQATLSHADSLWDWFGIDENGNIYVKKDAQGNARNFYTYGEVTAGGIGTGGGGTTGGITRIYLGTDPTPYQPAEGSTEVTLPAYPVIPTALSAFTDDVNHRLVTDAQITAWNAKQNSLGTGTNGQILSWQNNAPAWITAPATGVITFNGRSGAVSLTLADVEGVLNLTPIENAIKSLQSQVDSVAARDGFDELIVTSLFADMLVGADIYGALHGNADSATNADTLDGQHGSYFATASALTAHINNTSNPHSVTKSQVGLGNVENKSSATIRGELTASNVTTALGSTYVQNANYASNAGGVAWGNVSGRPTALSQFTDDVVSGHYLPLSGGTMKGDLVANTTSINLGTPAKPWGRIYANRWYPNANDTTNYIEYTNGGFLVHGNIAATGEVAAGS